MKHVPVAERFFEKTMPEPNSGCLLWLDHTNRKGYGLIRDQGKNRAAHRVAWEIAHGPIPDGLFVCHRCDNPSCVEVTHLFLGTNSDNMKDMHRKGRGNSKLTPAAVAEIRQRYKHGAAIRAMAREYGVDAKVLRLAAKGRTWTHVVA